MCGLFDVDDRPGVHQYLRLIGVQDTSSLITGLRRRPTQAISIVTTRHGQPRLEVATWHLYLARQGDRWVPDKRYWSINTNWRKIDDKPEFLSQRCLIPATAWVESQEGESPVQFDYGPTAAFMFCGLYRVYGNRVLGASIITLPAPQEIREYHARSIPWVASRTRSFAHTWLTHAGRPPFSIMPLLWKGGPLYVQPLRKAMDTTPAGPRVEL